MKPISEIVEGDAVIAVEYGSREIIERKVVGNWLDRTETLIGLKTPSQEIFGRVRTKALSLKVGR
jgi:hypothetical protein